MSSHDKRSRSRVAVFTSIAASLLVIDQATKLWAQTALADGATRPIIPGLLSFTLVHNPGATLGFGSSMTWLITVVALLVCVALVVMALRTRSLQWTVALSIAFAGAAGNLIDRIVHARGVLDGRVVDFLNYGWSVGNVADIVLMVAAVCISLLILRGVPLLLTSPGQPHDAENTDTEDTQDRSSGRGQA